MQTFGKYFGKHMLQFVSAVIFVFILNIIIFAFMFNEIIYGQNQNNDPVNLIQQTANSLQHKNGSYLLNNNQQELLKSKSIWALLLDENGHVIWNLDIPKELNKQYSIQDIAVISHGYLNDYPVFLWSYEDGLLVLGYPKTSYMKIMTNYLPVKVVRQLPLYFMAMLLLDLGLLFLAYYLSKLKIIRYTTPIIEAITCLSKGQPVHIKTHGELADISNSLNKASTILEKKDTARANWIAGISHDVRTPLSMVMGYAAQLEDDQNLPTIVQQKAKIIRLQSLRMKNLVNDLNLSTRLEYNMQPLQLTDINLIAITRQVAVDFLNENLDEKYPIIWTASEDISQFKIYADKNLLKRALSNLIQNCQNHNPNGCTIYITVEPLAEKCKIIIEDDGIGMSIQELTKLKTLPHHMIPSQNMTEEKHGLGLLIVKQIVSVHKGTCTFEQGIYGGFKTILNFSN